MITADTKEKREEALTKILPYQKEDFKDLFRTMKGYEVVIRYLDPPLHEFLPHTDEEITELAPTLDMSFQELKNRVESLKEFNPMMGHRGCRLAITYPEIAIMQTRAVILAALEVIDEGIDVTPEIMIPLVGTTNELSYIKKIVCETADQIIASSNKSLKYKVGTMIEVPRACVIADEIIINGIIFSQPVQDVQCHFLFGHPGLQAINICQVRFCGFILYRYLHVIIIHGHRRSLYCKIFSQIISPDLGIADDLIQCHILICCSLRCLRSCLGLLTACLYGSCGLCGCGCFL